MASQVHALNLLQCLERYLRESVNRGYMRQRMIQEVPGFNSANAPFEHYEKFARLRRFREETLLTKGASPVWRSPESPRKGELHE